MRPLTFLFALTFGFLLNGPTPAIAQQGSTLFTESEPLKLEIRYDHRRLRRQRFQNDYIPGEVTIWMNSSDSLAGEIGVRPRGNNRRQRCRYTPLKIDFDPAEFDHPDWQGIKSLKLVSPCQAGPTYEQYLYQEYLVYLLYQELTPMSFRVRPAEITFIDTRKGGSYTLPAFFIEDIDDLAARNGCFELEPEVLSPEFLDESTTHLMAMFQYMIGNTDWYIANLHNMKVIRPQEVANQYLYPIPYDFDYCGLVDARYAVPREILGTEDVKQRLYLGPCLEDADIQQAADLFLERQDALVQVYESQSLLIPSEKSSSLYYIDQFFELLEDPEVIKDRVRMSCMD